MSHPQSSQLVSLRRLEFTTCVGSRHFVRFVTDDEIPIAYLEFFLNGFIAAEFIQPADGEVVFQEPVSRGSELRLNPWLQF